MVWRLRSRWWWLVRGNDVRGSNGCGCGGDVLVRVASRLDWLLLLILL